MLLDILVVLLLVSFFKMGDRRVCSSYRGITLFSLPAKFNWGYWFSQWSNRFKRNNAGSVMAVAFWTNSLPSLEFSRSHRGLPKQWLSREGFWLCSLRYTDGGALWVRDWGPAAMDYSVAIQAVRPHQYRSWTPPGLSIFTGSVHNLMGRISQFPLFHRILSLLIVNYVLLASSFWDLQHSLE